MCLLFSERTAVEVTQGASQQQDPVTSHESQMGILMYLYHYAYTCAFNSFCIFMLTLAGGPCSLNSSIPYNRNVQKV